MPASVGAPAPVYCESVAIYETALVFVGEEADCPGNIVGGCKAGHRHTFDNVDVLIASTGLVGDVHFGLYLTGANSVDAQSTSSPLGRESAGKANEAMLRGVVCRPICNTQ